MKQMRTIFAAVTLMLCFTLANAKDKVIIIDGYFFKEMPGEIKNGEKSGPSTFFMLSTPNGASALGMTLQSPLSDEAIKFAIPVGEVEEGEELLRRFNEAKAAGKGNSISFAAKKPMIKAGDNFPEFSATGIDGKTWTRADITGKVTVLNLWFTGCGPCRAEMPELSRLKDAMPDVMFFSSTYESPDVARQVLDKGTFNWIHLVNDTQFKEFIGSNGYPLTIVVDKDGIVELAEYGTSPEQRERIKNKIEELR